ncbi:MAG: thiamine-phosphate kinase, partial [Gammaproteobacteria bacterium]
MDEFALIRRYFARLTAAHAGVVLGVDDDAALLAPQPGSQLVVTTDTLIAGRHFPESTAPFDIGWKSPAVNLSDLAAMGATPRWFLLALSLPDADARWLEPFASGLRALADRHHVALVGGDTTRGPLAITITAIGEVPAGEALLRSGARVGDLICVTGTLGDAGLALALRPGLGIRDSGLGDSFLMARLNRPEPRVAAGIAMRGIATAAIDLSDGLAGDLQHILDA